MGLWAEVRRETAGPAGKAVSPGAGLVTRLGDSTAGKALIHEAVLRIADLWNAIETSGGSIAWEWILRGSPHGPKIQQAEDRVNAIGSRGNPAALKSACEAWVFAWREGIEAWKRRLAAIEPGPDQTGGGPSE
jgi:hypothetical protein